MRDHCVIKRLHGSSKNTSSPADAAVRLQGKFRWLAARLATKNPHLQDDLVQEMSVAVLECSGDNTDSFYCVRAESRALDYLEYERRRGMKSLEELKEEPAIPNKLTEKQIVQLQHVIKLFRMANLPLSILSSEFNINLAIAS